MSGKRVSGDCPKCGTYRDHLQKDRVTPGFLGGTYAKENVQYICANCHEEKTRQENSVVHKGNTYNVGRKASLETRAKMSAALKGNTNNLGRKASPEARAKMSAAGKGKKLSEEHKAKIGRVWEGRKHTEASKAKMRAAHKGKKLSQEHRSKIRARTIGRRHSAETRAKIGAAQKIKRWPEIPDSFSIENLPKAQQ